jgi:hypothetical protein
MRVLVGRRSRCLDEVPVGAAVRGRNPTDEDVGHLHLDDGAYSFITVGVPLSTNPPRVPKNSTIATVVAADRVALGCKDCSSVGSNSRDLVVEASPALTQRWRPCRRLLSMTVRSLAFLSRRRIRNVSSAVPVSPTMPRSRIPGPKLC